MHTCVQTIRYFYVCMHCFDCTNGKCVPSASDHTLLQSFGNFVIKMTKYVCGYVVLFSTEEEGGGGGEEEQEEQEEEEEEEGFDYLFCFSLFFCFCFLLRFLGLILLL